MATVDASVVTGAQSPAPNPPATPKQSWLSKVGHFLGKVIGLVAKEGKPVIDDAAKVATILLPQFAPEIAIADNLATKIASMITLQQGLGTAVAVAPEGAAKFNAVLSSVGPDIDAWVAASFPGAGRASDLRKAGVVQAIYDLVADLEGQPVVASA